MKTWHKAVIFIVVIITLIALLAYSTMENQNTLVTDDGFTLSYDYHYVSEKGVILLHMMDKSKEDWKDLTALLNKNGYSTIAIDFRGHGKSQGNWKNFNENDFQNMKYDIKAAKNFLVSKGVNKITIIGASIGANLALNYSASSDIKRLVLLSPGENYQNIKVFDALKNYNGTILLVASRDDYESYSTVQRMDNECKGSHKFVSYEKGGHGTYIFLTHPELKQSILEFLKSN